MTDLDSDEKALEGRQCGQQKQDFLEVEDSKPNSGGKLGKDVLL